MSLSFFTALAFFADAALFVPRPVEPLKDAEKQRIEALVQSLGSTTAKERRAARKSLEALEPNTYDLLRQLMGKATDVEIKDTLREMLAAYEATVSWKVLTPAEQKFISEMRTGKGRYEFNLELRRQGSIGICQIQDHLLIIPDGKLATKMEGQYGNSSNSSMYSGCNVSDAAGIKFITFDASKLVFAHNQSGKTVDVFGRTFNLSKSQIHLFNPDGSYRGRLIDKP